MLKKRIVISQLNTLEQGHIYGKSTKRTPSVS